MKPIEPMNLPRITSLRVAACPAIALLVLPLAVPSVSHAQAVAQPKVADTPPADKSKDIVELSPFEVKTEKDTGYFAENTLAGSRLNTNLADLASSITVVTKQQLEDTGSLDINDVFKYEASTEGSNTYTPVVTDRGTAKDTIGGYSLGNDGSTLTNAQANRVRGLTAPDAAINNFPTNNRLPFDAYNVQSIEITRGPNSLLFGLGTPGGIVNQTAAQAVLNRDTSTVAVRTDNYGSFRSSLSMNRSLLKDKLAVFGAFLYNDQQFARKPSSDLTRREYAALTYKPFSKTVIRGFAENYQNNANRPNSMTPRDWVTPWLQAGRPSYDPVTRMVTMLDTGKTIGPYTTSTSSPGFVTGSLTGTGSISNVANSLFVPGIQFADSSARAIREIDGSNTVAYFQSVPTLYAPAQTNPATATPTLASLGILPSDPRYVVMDRMWAQSTALPQPTTVINGKTYTYGSWQNPGVTNKSLYNWTKYNDVQTNFGSLRAGNYSLEVEHQILPDLYFNAGWLRQDIDSAENYTMGSLTGNTVQIDVNKNNIDGTPNKYFGLPYINEGIGGGMDTFYHPQTDDNYRAMLAYNLDLTKQQNFLKYFGRHRVLGLWSYQGSKSAVERWRNGYVSGDADGTLRFVPNLTLPGQQSALNGLTLMRKYYLASPGDPQATVTHSSGFYGNQGWNGPVTSQVQVYNYNTGQFQNDTVVEQALFSSSGSFRSERYLNSKTMAVQSYLWNDRLVTTLGWRHDDVKIRITSVGALTDTNGVVYAPAMTNAQLYQNGNTGLINHDAVMSRWWRWDRYTGNTKTMGGALHLFKDMEFARKFGGQGSLASEFLSGLTLYLNKSDNFNPPTTFQTDYFKKALPKPTGSGSDQGIGFSLFQNKLVVRVNWYKTDNQNERTSAASTLLGRLAYSDTTTGLAWASAVQRIRNGANTAVATWNTDTVNNVSDPVNQQKIYDLIKLPLNYYSGIVTGGTQNSQAKGTEIQLTYNPTRNWTIKWTGDHAKTSYTDVAPQYDAWLAVRLPVWQTIGAPEIADFTDGGGVQYSLKNFWNGYGFTNVAQKNGNPGNTSPQDYFNSVVVSQVALAKALQGVTAPDLRQYHTSILTNYRFTEGRLKGFGITFNERWESKAAVGFLGKVGDPVNAPTVISVADPTKPVYDHGNYYTDIGFSYSRKVFGDKIGWRLQLNINNALENGRLMPTAVNFDGSPWSFRIIDPRQFVLTSTFTF